MENCKINALVCTITDRFFLMKLLQKKIMSTQIDIEKLL